MTVRVATAAETVAAERATIGAGTPAAELMRRAGTLAAREILRRLNPRESGRVLVFTGAGNNGGDGWVVARELARNAVDVCVREVAESRSPEAAGARAEALSEYPHLLEEAGHHARVGTVVDALLGTGFRGSPRGSVDQAIRAIGALRASGASVASLDLPSGLDCDTGAHGSSVRADLTLTFGVVKRGLLSARHVCGQIVVLDIGLRGVDELPVLVDAEWVRARVPVIPFDAHKGTRKKVSIVGGGRGMAGAAILAARAALRSSVGLLRLVVSEENRSTVHSAVPEAVVESWPQNAGELEQLVRASDALGIGPGLGRNDRTRDLVERLLLAWDGPVVLDADALNVFERDVSSLAKLVQDRTALLTPHPVELARMLGGNVAELLDARFDAGLQLARDTGAAVLLKGTPTVVFRPDGRRLVVAAGTAALATGGSGDMLTGIATTLLAQSCASEVRDVNHAVGDAHAPPRADVAEMGAVAAWIHGRAAEMCGRIRGVTLEDVMLMLPGAWNEPTVSRSSGVLAQLAAVN